MIPAPLSRRDRYYAHISPVEIDRANFAVLALGRLTRLFGGLHPEPHIPYRLKTPDSPLRFANYELALGALGLTPDDVRDVLRPGMRHIHREPSTGRGRYLHWAAYVARDESHAILEIANPYYMAGFCFAHDGGGVVLDQILVGNVDRYYAPDLSTTPVSSIRFFDIAGQAVADTVRDIRSGADGIDEQYNLRLSFIVRYAAFEHERALSRAHSLQSLAGYHAGMIRIGANMDVLENDFYKVSRNALSSVQDGLGQVSRNGMMMRDSLDAIHHQSAACAKLSSHTAQGIRKHNP